MLTNVSNELDRSILRLLEVDGRLPSLEIARRLGVSEKTIRLRVARLMRDHGMRVVATVSANDRQTRMLFLVHTEAGRRFEVAESLARTPQVQRVFATTGAFELVVEASFTTDADALEFLVREVERVDGVSSCQSVHLIKEVVPGALPPALSRESGTDVLDFGRFVALAARATREEEVLQLGADAALSVCGADRSLVSTLEISHDPVATTQPLQNGSPLVRMTRSFGRGLTDDYVKEVVVRVNERKSRGVTYRVVETGLHVFVEDALIDPLFEGLYDLVRSEGYRSLLAVPMYREERVFGSVNLYYNQRRKVSSDEIAVAQAFADQLSLALSRVTRTPDDAPATPA